MKNYENKQFSLDNKQLIISQLTCPICSGIFRNAIVITKCMHSFCEACLINSLSIQIVGIISMICFFNLKILLSYMNIQNYYENCI